MGQKICPLSFFNFYINKEAAQAGGCHLCVEEACALWDENYQQCSMKSGLEAVGSIADFLSNSSEKEDSDPFPKSSPINGILNKLRKKKLEGNLTAKVVAPAASTPAPAPPPPPPPAPVSNSSAAVAVTTPVTGQAPLVGNPNTPIELEASDVINRPQVPISELPIITLNSSSKEDDLKL